MRVLVVAANTERINLPTLPLGAALVAAAAEAAGHEVAFLDLMGSSDPATAAEREIERFRPEVIGLSVRNIDDQEMAQPVFLLDKARPVVEACRRASTAPLVLGGAGFTLFPEQVLTYLGADLGVCGEGDQAFPALLDSLARGTDPVRLAGVHAPGRWPEVRRASVTSLDDVRDPGGRLWTAASLEDRDLWVPVQTRRGCPYRCSYCSTPHIEGGKLRTRSPRLVAEWLRRMAAAGVRRVQFVDNIFNVPREYALELCRKIRALEVDLEWLCILFPHDVDRDLARAMAEAGCQGVSLGFESGSDRVLGFMNKRFRTADVRRASDLLAEQGIRQMGFLLLGGPGETRETVRASLDFAQALDLAMLRVTVGIRIYPGTPLAATAVEEGVLSPDDDLLLPRFYLAPGLEGWIRDQLVARGL